MEKHCASWKLLVSTKHCKEWDYSGINHLPTGAGFLHISSIHSITLSHPTVIWPKDIRWSMTTLLSSEPTHIWQAAWLTRVEGEVQPKTSDAAFHHSFPGAMAEHDCHWHPILRCHGFPCQYPWAMIDHYRNILNHYYIHINPLYFIPKHHYYYYKPIIP